MDRRQQSRVFVDLPVHIWGMDTHSRPFTQPASLRTISGRGATLQCVDARLKPGDVVEVGVGQHHACDGRLAQAIAGMQLRRGFDLRS